MKQILKAMMPPILKNLANKILQRNIRWVGNYSSWQEAEANSRTYDPKFFLQQLFDSAKTARDHEGMCERDSILFDKITYPYPLLSNLFAFSVFFQSKSLFILDFGGSLGSLYFQNKKFLRFLPQFTWHILEQEKIIEVGKKEFQTHQLLFHYSLEEAKTHIQTQDTKILILSAVLQYLKDPYSTLKELLESIAFDAIIIDRTIFATNDQNQIAIQKVPKFIYDTEYPCHLLSKTDFLNFFKRFQPLGGGGGYVLFDEFGSYTDENQSELYFLGFSFLKESQCLKK